jgi:hypothetical protein
LQFLGGRDIPRADLIEQPLRPVELPRVDRRLSSIAELGNVRIIGTERADTYQQRLVVRRNLTELRIEVFQRNTLLFKDFEEAREGRLRDAELCSQTLKLLGRYPLRLRNSQIQVAGSDVR